MELPTPKEVEQEGEAVAAAAVAKPMSKHLKLENASIEFSDDVTPRFTLVSDSADEDVKPLIIYPRHMPKIVKELPALYIMAKMAQTNLDMLKAADDKKNPPSDVLFEKTMIKSKIFTYKLRVDTFRFKSYIKLQMYVSPAETPDKEYPCHGTIVFSTLDEIDTLRDFVSHWVTFSKMAEKEKAI